jgi:serine/threonine-protein kinase
MMLTEKGTLKVLDFGIARLLGSARMTRAGNIIGTLEYMAPEQVRGLETDGRSDIYALGMMLYEVLVGRLPFDTQNEFELMKMQTEVMPQPPRQLNPAIPEAVEQAIMKAVQKDPDQRFQTAGDFREMLLAAGLGSEAVMHGATGSYKRSATSKPPVSSPGFSGEATVAMKQTRLAPGEAPASAAKLVSAPTRVATAPAAAPTAGGEMKATRFAPAAAVAAAPEAAASGSFFSKLGVVHYAVAGVVLLMLIGGAVAVPFILMGGKGAANTAETKKTDTTSQKPEVITQPQSAAPAQPPPVQTSSQAGVPQSGGELAPVETKAADKPAPSARQPVAAQKPAAPAPKKQDKAKLLEKIATQN